MATIELDPGSLGALAPVRWVSLAQAGRLMSASMEGVRDQRVAKPRTVRVRVGRQADDAPDVAYRLPAGVWWRPESDDDAIDSSFATFVGAPALGVLRFTYGSAEIQRTLFCDLASGEYVLPPCDFVTVSAARYTPQVDAVDEFGNAHLVDRVPVEVVADIADGNAIDFTPMILTAPAPDVGWASNVAKVACPPGAYAFDVLPNDPSDAGRVEVFAPGAVRDFDSGQWTPPTTPLPVVSPWISLRATGAGRRCKIVFFVR
jgi:hypothetical protein